MPKDAPRDPARFLLDIPGGEEEEVTTEEEELERERTRAEARRRMEEEKKKEEKRKEAEVLLDQIFDKWNDFLDHEDLEHKYISEYASAFDNQDLFWELNFTLLRGFDNLYEITESLSDYSDYSSEEEDSSFNHSWNNFLHDFDEEDRELIEENVDPMNAYEAFDDAWRENEIYNPEDLFNDIPLLMWKPEIYYLVSSEERRAFYKEARNFLSLGNLNEFLAEASENGYHLARIGGIFDGKGVARDLQHGIESRTPLASIGDTYITICDKRGRCSYRISGKHINFKPQEGWELDLGRNSFGNRHGFESIKDVTDGETWFWDADNEPEDVQKKRERYLGIYTMTVIDDDVPRVWRPLPEGRFGFNIPPH